MVHSIIELNGVSFFYSNSSPTLNKIHFRVGATEKIGIIGNNGCGKSTFLMLIMGLLPIHSGQLKLFGQEIQDEKDFREARLQIGLLFQNSDDQLFSPTVLEDVAFGPLNQGKTPKEARQIALETLASLRLEGFENQITHRLSGGQKKLVALATILAMSPKILLLDEPTSGLDPHTKDHFQKILADWKGSSLIVSHDYEFLSNTTEMIYGMSEGELSFQSTSAEIHAHYHQHPLGQFSHDHESHTEPKKSMKEAS